MLSTIILYRNYREGETNPPPSIDPDKSLRGGSMDEAIDGLRTRQLP